MEYILHSKDYKHTGQQIWGQAQAPDVHWYHTVSYYLKII